MCIRMTNEDALRKHPLRAAVLASLAEDERAVQPSQIQAELPGDPSPATVAYHLQALKGGGLVTWEDDCYRLSSPSDDDGPGAAGGQGPSTSEA